jgi:hypothetical protein
MHGTDRPLSRNRHITLLMLLSASLLLTAAAARGSTSRVAPTAVVAQAEDTGAGCTPNRPAVPHHSGAMPVADPPALPAGGGRPVPCLAFLRQLGNENLIGVNPKGTLFWVPAMEPGTGRFQVATSHDKGATWDARIPAPPGADVRAGTDPVMYVDPDVDLVLFGADVYLGQGCGAQPFTRSTDEGRTWALAPSRTCPAGDQGRMFGGPPKTSRTASGFPNLVYYVSNYVNALYKSLDGGVSFTRTGTNPYVDTRCENLSGLEARAHFEGNGAVGPDGTVSMAEVSCDDIPQVAVSGDEGSTWKLVDVTTMRTPSFTGRGVAVDKAGNIYVVWLGFDGLPYLAVSRDRGEHWSRPLMVAAPGVTETELPYVAATDTGHVAVVYYGSTNSPGRPAMSCRSSHVCPGRDGVTYDVYMAEAWDATSDNPTFWSAPLNDPRQPAWYVCAPGELGLHPAPEAGVYSEESGRQGYGPDCQGVHNGTDKFGAPEVLVMVAAGLVRTDFISVAFGPDGEPWASFDYDNCGPPASAECRPTVPDQPNGMTGIVAAAGRLAHPR